MNLSHQNNNNNDKKHITDNYNDINDNDNNENNNNNNNNTKIIFVTSISGQYAFEKIGNKCLKNKIINTINDGTINDSNQITSEMFSNLDLNNINNLKNKSNHIQYRKLVYGMSKVCVFQFALHS